ncbi:thioredoxin H-type-like [Lotus japonicus]|uniref:thioredoxin H-type-like n=1 Tax=Lotus japonicus TaxID=34305 RepID=UPI002588FA1B|nr:thioredoxin H-type-like [Lotus japonicus]
MGNCVVKVRLLGCLLRPKNSKIKHPMTKDDDDSDQEVEFASANVEVITTKESWDQKLEQARRDGKVVVANFSATWCGPCKTIAPCYCELSEKYPSIMFLVVDVDELTDFSTSWNIKATPTFFFLRDGQEIDKLIGANKPELEKKIASVSYSVLHSQ